MKQCSRVKLPSGQEVRSSGLAASEFLVKLQWVRALHPDGSHETGVLLQEAQPLIHGKKVPDIVAACTKDWKTLRNCGHRGIALEHYVCDRAGYTALERFFRRYHQELQGGWAALGDEPGPSLADLQLGEIVVCTPCALRDCHTGFRWCMHGLFQERILLMNICFHRVIAKSYDLIQGHLADWVSERGWCSETLRMNFGGRSS